MKKIEIKKLKCVQQLGSQDVDTDEFSISVAMSGSSSNNAEAPVAVVDQKERSNKEKVARMVVINIVQVDNKVTSLALGDQELLNIWLNAIGRVFIDHY